MDEQLSLEDNCYLEMGSIFEFIRDCARILLILGMAVYLSINSKKVSRKPRKSSYRMKVKKVK